MDSNEPLDRLLLLIVEQHQLHNGRDLSYVRTQTRSFLTLGSGHPEITVPNSDLDFELLQNERMIIFPRANSMTWRVKPTPLGIATAQGLKQKTGAVYTTATPDSAAEAHEVPEPAPDIPTVDLERLIASKDTVEVPTAARYLECGVQHLRRLIREGKLEQAGQRKRKQISTASLRKYKGT